MKAKDYSIEKILLLLGPVRFIIFLLFPFLIVMCAYSYSIDKSIDDCVLHMMVFCLFINDLIINHWNDLSSYQNFLKINQGQSKKNTNVDLSDLRNVKFLKKGNQKNPHWSSSYMQKVKRDNHRFLYVFFALVVLSITIDYIPENYRDWILFFLSTIWSFLLVREINVKSKSVALNKKFMMLCYNLAFAIFIFGVLVVQN